MKWEELLYCLLHLSRLISGCFLQCDFYFCYIPSLCDTMSYSVLTNQQDVCDSTVFNEQKGGFRRYLVWKLFSPHWTRQSHLLLQFNHLLLLEKEITKAIFIRISHQSMPVVGTQLKKKAHIGKKSFLLLLKTDTNKKHAKKARRKMLNNHRGTVSHVLHKKAITS